MFEFIDEVDLAMFGWGTSKQQEALLSGYLSEEIKFRTAEFSDNFTNSVDREEPGLGQPSRFSYICCIQGVLRNRKRLCFRVPLSRKPQQE